ncbi:MAG: V-type ATP synthase subunit I [Bacteroidales bacterium]|nr:V-type ATP synthase subunit I [Bacteroidales bacterium]
MKKYSFLVYHQEYKPFLVDIQNIGVLDVIKKNIDLDENSQNKLSLINELTKTIKFLKLRQSNPETTDEKIDGLELFNSITEKQKKLEELNTQIEIINKEIENINPWGDFSLETIENLNKANFHVRFFIAEERKFSEEWDEKYNLLEINKYKSNAYFIIISKDNNEIDIEADEIKMPERPVSEVLKIKQEIENEIQEIYSQLSEYSNKFIPALTEKLNSLKKEFEFDNVLLNTTHEAENKLMVLQGWVAVTKEEELKNYLDKKGIIYFSEDAKKEEKVPILLKNNKFSSLFEPIGKLFSMPSYQELDLTAYFAPFFMLFFGFCLGDTGYGIVLLVAASLLKLKFKNKKDVKPLLSLVQFLGIGTIIMGAVSGTLFGVSLGKVESIGNMKDIFLSNDQLLNFSMALGGVQIIFGIVLRAVNKIKQQGFIFAIPEFGWILLLISILDLALIKYMVSVSQIALYISLGMIVFFSNPKGNIFAAIGKGIWDLYGITGIFGDVLSYIRLFALGVSSSILGFVINSMALQVKEIPYIGYGIFILFLVLGHTGNILLSSLGSFVHPMRLTFVEFYKNAGFEGGGKEYKPFSNKIK